MTIVLFIITVISIALLIIGIAFGMYKGLFNISKNTKLKMVKNKTIFRAKVNGKVYGIECLNNDVQNKKILVKIEYVDKTFSEFILPYHHEWLKDFDSINFFEVPKPKNIKEKLTDILNERVEKEDFKNAAILRDTINKVEI